MDKELNLMILQLQDKIKNNTTLKEELFPQEYYQLLIDIAKTLYSIPKKPSTMENFKVLLEISLQYPCDKDIYTAFTLLKDQIEKIIKEMTINNNSLNLNNPNLYSYQTFALFS